MTTPLSNIFQTNSLVQIVNDHDSQIGGVSKKTGWLDKKTGWLDVISDYGAIGDGLQHPLSGVFSTIQDAQFKYPNVGITALTQQLNWAAFQQAFYDANQNKVSVRIPYGTFYIKDSLNIGVSTTNSIEYGNFEIVGTGKGTILQFDIQDQVTPVFNIAPNATKLSIRRLFMKNLTPHKGVGIFVPFASMNIELASITAYQFYNGFDLNIYVGNVRDCIAGYGSCGFRIRGGTASVYSHCYGTNNTLDSGDTNDYAGCNWYIGGGNYCGLVHCASDSGTWAYKISSPTATANIAWTFTGCGMESNTNAMYIDAPTANISLINPTTYANGSPYKLAHVENATSVIIDSLKGSQEFHASRNSAKVGAGVVRFVHTSLTPSNPTLYQPTASVDRSVWGINDFVFDTWAYGASDGIQEGRMIYKGNILELQLFPNANGSAISLMIDIIPRLQYDQTTLRAGRVSVHVFNSTGVSTPVIDKSNAGIVVNKTAITGGATISIDPFNGTQSAASSIALFYVTVIHTDIDKNHNIIPTGTFTGRTAVKLKGVDY